MRVLGPGGRVKTRPIHEIKELTRDDLRLLEQKRTTPVVQRFRDPHHMLARCIAMGLRSDRAAERCGFSRSRVLTFMADPAFKELVAHYRSLVDDAFRDEAESFLTLASSNMLKAERMIAEKLDAADEMGETLPMRELLAVVADRADRTGFGKKSTQVNVNVDFAAKLEGAIKRAGQVLHMKPVGPGALSHTAETLAPEAARSPQALSAPSAPPGVVSKPQLAVVAQSSAPASPPPFIRRRA